MMNPEDNITAPVVEMYQPTRASESPWNRTVAGGRLSVATALLWAAPPTLDSAMRAATASGRVMRVIFAQNGIIEAEA
jgi:hypothetical protein